MSLALPILDILVVYKKVERFSRETRVTASSDDESRLVADGKRSWHFGSDSPLTPAHIHMYSRPIFGTGFPRSVYTVSKAIRRG